ncbi:MAG: hypothetical protein ACREXS_12170, partial [Gammaproteobacteria bacterium]
VDHASLAKMDYAIETLFPCIPMAFRAGIGLSQVERIRTLENILVAFLKDRKLEGAVDEARRWFPSSVTNRWPRCAPILVSLERPAVRVTTRRRPNHSSCATRSLDAPAVPGQTPDTSPERSDGSSSLRFL